MTTAKPRAKPTSKPKAQRREETTARILDAAEALFARDGLHGVTLKAVAKEAGVDTALLHYYFDDKNRLFSTVFGRRAEVVNRARLDSLDRYEAEFGDDMTIRGAIDAFLRPLFVLFDGDPSWLNYAALVAQVNNTPVWGGDTMHQHFDPVIHRFIGVLQRISPETPDRQIYWFYHLLSGSLTLSLAQTGRIDTLSGGLCKSSEMVAICDAMETIFTGGFEAMRRT
ncbi:TetR/AcrR family transcriptional regulator [Brevundimonas nasdae]|uniref:TetR family transcriptional regulator n=1 Tax=Brevundimonas nasdae TaxID=172043 RepID=A0ABX8TKR9_9CAUL|nr:TetR/AcrR family transcriptional regulator [Brevundimonas nasdae]QYC11836.1 TetR family transcriptional regulator [Brevundimonas nasdae]QYC14622.1 TetR family transcriptional regulator [Brevundimonas nasdae]